MKDIKILSVRCKKYAEMDVGATNFSNFNFDTYNSLTPNWYYKVLR